MSDHFEVKYDISGRNIKNVPILAKNLDIVLISCNF